jgi:hypothetical protein
MEHDHNWRDYRKAIELSPEVVADALNSQAEDMIFISNTSFPVEAKPDSICILLGAEKKLEETLLYFRKESSDVMFIHIREKANPKKHIVTISAHPLSKAETVQTPSGMKGVVFTLKNKGEILVLEDGFVSAMIIQAELAQPS